MRLQTLALTACLVAIGAGQTPAPKSDLVPARPRDREVLQAFLAVLADDPKFPVPEEWKGSIVLHERSPTHIRLIVDPFVLNADAGGKVLPRQAKDDLVKRNQRLGSREATGFAYEPAWFTPPVVVADCTKGSEIKLRVDRFHESYPESRCWVEAWIPGYTKDGKTALVRARIGPSPKGATVTGILKLEGAKWVVAWHRYAVYQ